jgi:hypothetical protein
VEGGGNSIGCIQYFWAFQTISLAKIRVQVYESGEVGAKASKFIQNGFPRNDLMKIPSLC